MASYGVPKSTLYYDWSIGRFVDCLGATVAEWWLRAGAQEAGALAPWLTGRNCEMGGDISYI